MKKLVILAAIFAALSLSACNKIEQDNNDVPQELLYEDYIKASEELLWDLEAICEANGIDWGDTVCEGDSWDNFCAIRERLGLEYLQHHSKRR